MNEQDYKNLEKAMKLIACLSEYVNILHEMNDQLREELKVYKDNFNPFD